MALVAQNQYVDSSWSGLPLGTLASPYKVLSSINQSALDPGDSVLLKRGYNYAGNLTITKGGTVGNAIVYSSYGTGARAKLIGTGSTINSLFYMNGPDYITFTQLDITDPTLNADDTLRIQLAKIQRAFYVDAGSSNIITSYMNVNLVGVGCYWVGSNNSMLYCNYSNMRMVVDDNDGGVDDYGANPITIGGNSSNNLVSHCGLNDLWAHSYDFGKDGGAFEIYSLTSTSSNNRFEYNFINDGIGVFEITGNTAGLEFIYNIFINNGSLYNFQPGYSHSGTVITNNSFVLTQVSPVGDSRLFYGNPVDLLLTNNLFYLRGGCDVASTGTGITNTYNRYNMGAGSTTGMSGGTGETAGTTIFWVAMIGEPKNWDYHVQFAIPGKPGGTGLSTDYYGVSGTNDYMGVAKYVSYVPPVTGTINFPIEINGVKYDSITN